MLVRASVFKGNATPAMQSPGDILGTDENLLNGLLATNGAGIWTGALIANGLIRRTVVGAGYTDTTDSSTNIIAALAGNNAGGAIVEPGTSFRLLFQNTIAQAMTWAAGAGVLAGTGTLDTAASLVREYLVTVLNSSPAVTLNSNTTNGNKVITFNFPTGTVSWPIGPSAQAVNITPGMLVSGTGITAGTKVLGVTLGVGGITGVTTDTNSTATSSGGVALSFLPVVLFDGLRSSTL